MSDFGSGGAASIQAAANTKATGGREAWLALAGLALLAATIVTQVLSASVFDDLHLQGGSALAYLHTGKSGQREVLAGFGILLVLFLAAVVIAGDTRTGGAHRIALFGAGLLTVTFLLAYPSSSLDVFKYIADTRTLTVYHQNPLNVPPSVHPSDPLYRSIPPGQQRERGFYGPAFYALAAPASLIAGDSVRANLVAFKLLNAAAFLALVLMTARIARRIAPERATQAIVLTGWNPYLLYEGVGNAHNDLLMVVLCVAGLMLAAESRQAQGVVAWAAGAAIKYVTVFTSPVLFLWLWRNSGGRARILTALAAVASTIAALAVFVVEPDRIRAFGIFNETTFRTPYALAFRWFHMRYGTTTDDLARWGCLAVFGVITLIVLAKSGKTERALYAAAFWVLAAASAFTVSYAWPWYFLWFVPLGALLAGSIEAEFAVVCSITALMTTGIYPYASHVRTDNWVIGLMYGVPALALPVLWLARRSGLSLMAPRQGAESPRTLPGA